LSNLDSHHAPAIAAAEDRKQPAADHEDIMYPSAIPFVLVHLACFAAIWTGVTWTAVAQSTAQKSVLWWAAKHRHHHLHSDTEADVHSPRQHGFLYSHVGWIFSTRHDATDFVKIEDFARYPELRWLHRLELSPAVVLALICLAIGGWSGLVVGFFWGTVATYHATFCINSLAHVHGRRRYVTGDDSRNNWLLAFFTMGEGWHNNHHAFPTSARHGLRWWQADVSYYLIRSLAFLGLAWNVRLPADRAGAAEEDLPAVRPGASKAPIS
jgi:stearoyl-CoA desaturase (delta-9 desaturase)